MLQSPKLAQSLGQKTLGIGWLQKQIPGHVFGVLERYFQKDINVGHCVSISLLRNMFLPAEKLRVQLHFRCCDKK